MSALLGLLFALAPAAQASIAALIPKTGRAYMYQKAPRRMALVIGNVDYTALPTVGSVDEDMRRMHDKLMALHFDITQQPNVVDVTMFNRVLSGFIGRLKPGDLVVVYFSGHGFSYLGDSYLVPTQAPLQIAAGDVGKTAVGVAELQAALERQAPGVLILLLDSCRVMPGFTVSDGMGGNLVAKGYVFKAPPPEPPPPADGDPGDADSAHFSNVLIGYATRNSYESTGYDKHDVPSLFTGKLTANFTARDIDFRQIFHAAAVQVLIANSQQDPGMEDWDHAATFLNPGPDRAKSEQEVWRAALSSSQPVQAVEGFLMLNSVSPYAAAARQWLQDRQDQPVIASGFSRLSPLQVDQAWKENGAAQVAVQTADLPVAFYRMTAGPPNAAVAALSDAEIGLVPSGTSAPASETSSPAPPEPEASAPLASTPGCKPAAQQALTADAPNLKLVLAQETVVSVQKIAAAAAPDCELSTARTIQPGTKLQVVDVANVDGHLWMKAQISGEAQFSYVNVDAGRKLAPVEVGQSLSQIMVPAGKAGLPGAADKAAILDAVNQLKRAGRRITWVSLASAKPGTRMDAAERVLRLAYAQYVLRAAGIDGRRITAVNGTSDFSGDAIRLRFFGY